MAKARYQHQHGTKSAMDNNVSSILTDEIVVVDSGAPLFTGSTGSSVYYKPSGFSSIVRLVNADEIQNISFDGVQYGQVQEAPTSGSATYDLIDTATERDTLYATYASNGGDQGFLVFNGSTRFSSGTDVSQIRTTRLGAIQYRIGQTSGSGGAVDWNIEGGGWKNYATEDYVDNILGDIETLLAAI